MVICTVASSVSLAPRAERVWRLDTRGMANVAKATITAWLQRVLVTTGWDAAELVRRSGVSAPTLSRALNAEDKHVLNSTNLLKIAHASGIAPPTAPGGAKLAGLHERECEPYTGPIAFPGETDTLDRWQIKAMTLAAIGCFPGDVLLVDRARQGQASDIVLAQLYRPGGADTVFRFYDPPYLVTRAASQEHHAKPELVDGQRALIMGVAIQLWRPSINA